MWKNETQDSAYVYLGTPHSISWHAVGFLPITSLYTVR